MPYELRPLAAPEVESGGLRVTPVARSSSIWWEGRSWASAAQYLGPAKLEITYPSGATALVPIPDRQLQMRLVAIALIMVAFVIRRLRK